MIVHDYTRRSGVEHTELVGAGERTRAELWNQAEAAEKRVNSVVAREIVVALPAELPSEARIAATRELAKELHTRYGVAVDLAVHAPSTRGDQRNHHAHLLFTTREISEQGFGAKTRQLDVKQTSRVEIEHIRTHWAEIANAHLQRQGSVERIDARSYVDQGVNRAATMHLGPAVTNLERQGVPSHVGDHNREVKQINLGEATIFNQPEMVPAHDVTETNRQGGVIGPDHSRGTSRSKGDSVAQPATATDRTEGELQRHRAESQQVSQAHGEPATNRAPQEGTHEPRVGRGDQAAGAPPPRDREEVQPRDGRAADARPDRRVERPEARDPAVEAVVQDFRTHTRVTDLEQEKGDAVRELNVARTEVAEMNQRARHASQARATFDRTFAEAYRSPEEAKSARANFDRMVSTEGPDRALREFEKRPEQFGRLAAEREPRFRLPFARQADDSRARQAAQSAARDGRAAFALRDKLPSSEQRDSAVQGVRAAEQKVAGINTQLKQLPERGALEQKIQRGMQQLSTEQRQAVALRVPAPQIQAVMRALSYARVMTEGLER